jgi:predicted nucleotidyltransferase component of viral defense system
MLSRRIVDHYASGMKIDTIVAEKDVVLTYVLKVLNQMEFLPNLAFKGGTCFKRSTTVRTQDSQRI